MAAIGEFEVLILMAALRLEDGAYAPAIRAEIERRTGRTVSRGAVYITLDRLETKGLLASTLADKADEGGRRRRYYRVPSKGVRAIRRTLSALEQMRQGLDPILNRA
jgi:PadR family transcriptional regulator, regulatory protein PadR